MAAGGTIDWAALAADLGYADQGHFIRDFKGMFGEQPTWYAQRYWSLSAGRVATGLLDRGERARGAASASDDRPEKGAESLVVRHQIMVLERQFDGAKVRFAGPDRALLAALRRRKACCGGRGCSCGRTQYCAGWAEWSTSTNMRRLTRVGVVFGQCSAAASLGGREGLGGDQRGRRITIRWYRGAISSSGRPEAHKACSTSSVTSREPVPPDP